MALVLLGAHVAVATALAALVAIGASASWLHRGFEPFAAHPRVAVAVAALALGWLLLLAWTAAIVVRGPARRPESDPAPGEPAEPASPAAGGRAGAGRLVEALAYAAASIAVTWPLVRDLGGRIVGDGDAHYYVWLGWRVGRLIAAGQLLPTFVPDVVWPYGFDLRLGEGYLPMMVNGVWNLLAGPVAAYNLSLLTATLLNLWAGRRLAARLSRDPFVHAACAIAFATAPALAVRLLGHHSLYFAFPTALVVEEACVSCAGDGRVRWLRVGLLWFLCYLCASYFLFGSALAFALMWLVRSLEARAGLRQLAGGALALAGGLALTALLMTPFAWKRAPFERAEREAGRNLDFELDYRTYSAGGLSLLAQPAGSTLELPGAGLLRAGVSDNVAESTAFPGFLLLTGLGAFALLRSRLRLPLLVAAASLWLLSLGPDPTVAGERLLAVRDGARVGWLPFALLVKLPLLSSLRAPARFGLLLPALLTAALAVAAGYALARSRGRARAGLTLLAVLLLLPNLIAPIRTSRLPFGPAAREGLATAQRRAGAGDSLLEVPTDCDGRILGESATLQIFHALPAVGCQAQHLALPWWSGLKLYRSSRAMAALRCHPEAFGHLEEPFPAGTRLEPGDLERLQATLGVRFLAVNKRQLQLPECAFLRDSGLEALGAFEVLAEDGRWKVLDLGPRRGYGAGVSAGASGSTP